MRYLGEDMPLGSGPLCTGPLCTGRRRHGRIPPVVLPVGRSILSMPKMASMEVAALAPMTDVVPGGDRIPLG